VIKGTVRRLFACAFVAIAAVPAARAELPQLRPFQTLEPREVEVFPDPEQSMQTPLFGASVALDGSIALSGMPGAADLAGRVAVFTRNASGSWVRSATLKASDAAAGAEFGKVVALASGRAFVASRTGVYAFALTNGVWRQTQKLSFDVPVRIADLAWNGSVAIVGVGVDDQGKRNSGAYLFALSGTGQLQRIARFTAHDTAARDLFGGRIAVAITAPGYNSDQGAAYYFTCTSTGCRERQKLLANDGKPGDHFGSSVDLRTRALVVGAPAATPTSQRAAGALGAAYVFERPDDTWIERQKLGVTAAESEPYWVLVSAPGLAGFAFGFVFVYDWSGGSLVATHALPRWEGYGSSLELVGNRAIVGFPDDGVPPIGFADVYYLPPHMP
jgi:FG-GAP repeat